MKRLKRLLAMGLTLTMALSLMAGAAFTDTEQLKTAEAVDMLTALNIIQGYPDGTFRPEDGVTRAEYAKMLYVLRNGGVDDGATYYKNAVKPFSDTRGHWAEGYINYAYTMGMIAGHGDGTFRPEDPVTGLESAKLLLTLLGYDAQRAGLVGTQWDLKTLSLASDKELFEDYEMDISSGAQRQYAAQMIYNALFTQMVKLSDGTYEDINDLLGEKYLSLSIQTGVLMSAGEYKLGDVTGAAEDKIVLVDEDGAEHAFDYEDELTGLLGREVRVVNNAKEDILYGVYETGENTVMNVQMGDIEIKNGKFLVDGQEVKISDGAKLYVDGTAEDLKSHFGSAKTSAQAITLISHDGDNHIDLAVTQTVKAGQITGIYKDRITTSADGYTSIVTKDEQTVVHSYEGMAKDDFVFLTTNPFDQSVTIVKMEETTGTVDAAQNEQVRVGGTWFQLATDAVSSTNLPEVGEAATLYHSGQYVYAVQLEESVSTDLALVTAASATADLNGNYQVKLMLANGESQIVSASAQASAGQFVTFTVKDDVYTLTEISSSVKAGFDKHDENSSGYVQSSQKLGASYIDDDAVIFLQYVTGGQTSYKVISGKTLKTMENVGDKYEALINTRGGFDYVRAALIVTSGDLPGITGELGYGYLMEAPVVTGTSEEKVVVYQVWNGSEQIELREQADSSSLTAGMLISYSLIGEGEVDNVQQVSSTKGAITAYNSGTGHFTIHGDSKTYAIGEDTVVLFVDSQSGEGYVSGDIQLADNIQSGLVNNVAFKAKTSAETNGTYLVEVLLVDVNNEMQ